MTNLELISVDPPLDSFVESLRNELNKMRSAKGPTSCILHIG